MDTEIFFCPRSIIHALAIERSYALLLEFSTPCLLSVKYMSESTEVDYFTLQSGIDAVAAEGFHDWSGHF